MCRVNMAQFYISKKQYDILSHCLVSNQFFMYRRRIFIFTAIFRDFYDYFHAVEFGFT